MKVNHLNKSTHSRSYKIALFFLTFVLLAPELVISQDNETTSESSNCGEYNVDPALEYGRLYQEALAERDYDRLKELREQKDNTDLWAKTDVECSSGENQASLEGNSDELGDGPSIVTNDDGARSADLKCEHLEGNEQEKCYENQASCSLWIQENDETGYAWLEHEEMPACPCNVTDVIDSEPDWGYTSYSGFFGTGLIGVVDVSNYQVRRFHEGALGGCARSATVDVGNTNPSAQQCCYGEINETDNSGQLITAGTGAGTPDIDAADSINPLWDGHMASDVDPWKACGPEIYNQIRKPNNANSCPANIQPIAE